MYFPYLRGRQYELLALRELVSRGLISNKVIPIVQPVKLSTTLVNTMAEFIRANHNIAVIRNPAVGTFISDLQEAREETKEAQYKQRFNEQYQNSHILKSLIMAKDVRELIEELEKEGTRKSDMLIINTDRECLELYLELFSDASPCYTLIPKERAFKRKVQGNKVLLDDKFEKQPRNAAYQNKDDEFFSDDHLEYVEENYIGFSDYSIVGNEYLEAGFAPYAVAIHIVYFDDDKSLRVKHFVSTSNEDITNPALKFYEAVKKLYSWYNTTTPPVQLTAGLDAFIQHYKNGTYPGLGTVKKLSIMHHLELMSKYLSRE